MPIEDLIQNLKKQLDDFKLEIDINEVGEVVKIGDGIAYLSGLNNCQSFEMLEFPNNILGVALNLEQDFVGAILLGDYESIKEGDIVKRTKKVLSFPASEEMIGRVVDPLGRAIDGGKKRKEKSKMIFLSSILTLPIIVVIVMSLLLMWISVGISSSEDVSGFGLMIAWFLYPAAIFSYLISLLILIGNWLNQRRKKFKKLESFYFKDKSRRKNTKNIKQYFNKRISTQTAFFVIILLVFIIGIGTWYLVKYEYPGNEPSPITTAKPMEVNSEFNNCGQIAEEMNESTDKLKALANSLTEITQLYCVDTNIEERQLTEEYSGFPWIDQNKEIELIKGYQWYIFGTPGDYSQSVIDNCINTITVCLEENFVSNTENTDIDEKIFSFERGDIKCVFRIQPNDFQYFELSCGDITKNTTPVFYREIYNFLNSAVDLSKRVEIIETEGNFAIANTGTGYGYFLLKKVGDKWIEVTDLGEAEIDCDIVFNYGVPPSLVNNICIYYKTTREVWRHNEDSAKWEKWYNLDNPQDKK